MTKRKKYKLNPNITASIRHALLYEFRRSCYAENTEVSSVVQTLVARNEAEVIAAATLRSGRICIWRESGLWCTDLCWCVSQEVVIIFWHLICFVKTCHHLQTLGLLACSDLPVGQIGPSISSVVDLSLLPLGR